VIDVNANVHTHNSVNVTSEFLEFSFLLIRNSSIIT